VPPRPFDPDPAQRRVLQHRDATLLVLGAAGTGKTTVLRERFARAIESGADPERVALVVGSKRARHEAESAVLDRLGRSLPILRVTTIHGLAFGVATARFEGLGYREPPDVLDAVRQFALVRELLDREHPDRWPAYGSLLSLRGFADELRQLVLRAQESLVSADDLRALAARNHLGGWDELAGFLERYLEEVRVRGALDFAGLLVRAADAATAGPPMFDEVLVDDFQDSTVAGHRLLSSLGARTLIVAGNEAAHVFSFQGTTVAPLRRLVDDALIDRVTLETSHRTPAGPIRREAWTAAHASEEHRAIARELRRIHVEDGVPWNHLAVVVRRQSAEAQALLRALDDAAIPREASDPDLSPEAAPGTRPYVVALRWIASDLEWRDEHAEVVMTSELGGVAPAAARSLLRIARAHGVSPSGALSLQDGLSPAERDSLRALRETLAAAEERSASVEDALRVLWQRLPCSARLVERAETSEQARAETASVRALIDAAAVWAAGPDPSVAAFVASLGAREGAPEPAGASGDARDVVHVLTAHATSGMEFDTVIVAGAEEGNFPSLRRPEPMFDLGALERSPARSDLNRERIADERRLFDVVLSRARRRVVLTASRPVDGEDREGLVSRFADDLDVTWEPVRTPPFPDPVSVAEAAATWRRELAGATPNAGARLAALRSTLALGVDPSAWWFRRDWTPAAPRDAAVRLSFSRLDRLENCELQFALSEELGLDPGGGYQAWVGRLIHVLIEDVENGKLPRTREAFERAVEDAWQPERFPSFAISEAERRNAIEVLIPNWFDRYGDPALAAEATETRFRFELADATLTGKIDRIGPGPDGGRRITDFKTGRGDTAGDAAENLQLGIYYLAVADDEDLGELRPIDAVELAFLAGTKARNESAKIVEWRVDPDAEAEYATRMRERVRGLAERVRELSSDGSYTASTSAECFFCGFRTMCSRYPQGMPVFEAPVSASPAPAGSRS